MFKHITVEAFAEKALATLVAQKQEKPAYGLAYPFTRFAKKIEWAQSTGGYFRAVLGARVKTESERVMSDVWEYITRRHILIFGSVEGDDGKYTSGLHWVQDGSYGEGCMLSDFNEQGVTYYFHEPDTNIEDRVFEQITAWVKDEAGKEEAERAAQEAADKVESEVRRVESGKTVRVVRGRKVPVGTEGRVFWVGDNAYGTSVGITKSGNKVGKKYEDAQFTSLNNVEAIVDEKALEAAKKEAYDRAYAAKRAAIQVQWNTALDEFGVGAEYAGRKLATA